MNGYIWNLTAVIQTGVGCLWAITFLPPFEPHTEFTLTSAGSSKKSESQTQRNGVPKGWLTNSSCQPRMKMTRKQAHSVQNVIPPAHKTCVENTHREI